MSKRRILITGLSGAVGRAIRPALDVRYEVAALSRVGVEGVADDLNFRGTVADLASIRPAFEDVDSVVHLAADGGVNSPTGMNAGWESILENNIVGTYNVFTAARDAGVRRVVFASTGAVVLGYEHEEPWLSLASGDTARLPASWPILTRDSEPKPHSLYAVSKLFGEDLARYFVNTSEMSILCLRISSVGAEDKVIGPRGPMLYCSHDDMAQMVVKCIEVPASVRYDIFYVVSDNRRGYRDWTHARDVVGYEPTGSAKTAPKA
ncbi:MAG: NAD(P)-dependent oxidoreductase [Candidatus Tectomicrobia bacterium]